MTTFWKAPLGVGLVLWSLGSASFSQPVEPMTHIEGAVVYPDGGRVATRWWRVGQVMARTEAGESGPGRPCEELVVYREPEIWMADLVRGRGRHVVDPGPSFGFHLPVAAYRGDLSWPAAILALEVGQEVEFLAAHGARLHPNPGRSGTLAAGWTDPGSGIRAEVVTTSLGRPLEVTLASGQGVLLTLAYDRFDRGLAPDPALFEPPAGVSFE